MKKPWITMNGVVRAVDRWAMLGTVRELAEPGMNIVVAANDGEHPSAWRIIDITQSENDTENWVSLRLRPLDQIDNIDAAKEDIHRGWSSEPWKTIDPWVNKLQEHYAVCSCCHHLMPCPDMVRQGLLEMEIEEFELFNQVGDSPSCPSCGEIVEDEDTQFTFETNLYAFGPVTFHLHGRCRTAAEFYDEEVHKKTGEPRKLYCPNVQYHLNNQGQPQRYWCQDAQCRGYDLKHTSTVNIFDPNYVPQNFTEIWHTAF